MYRRRTEGWEKEKKKKVRREMKVTRKKKIRALNEKTLGEEKKEIKLKRWDHNNE